MKRDQLAESIDKFRERLKSLIGDERGAESSFAQLLGISQATLQNILKGGPQGPTVSKLYELIDKLGKEKVWWLLTGEEYETPPPAL